MTPGEINKAIAEMVMGWKVSRIRVDYSGAKPLYTQSIEKSDGMGFYKSFAADISAAWLVVGKVIETGADFFLYYDKEKECWTCEISSEEASSAFIEDGETESLAICSSALRLFSALKEKE